MTRTTPPRGLLRPARAAGLWLAVSALACGASSGEGACPPGATGATCATACTTFSDCPASTAPSTCASASYMDCEYGRCVSRSGPFGCGDGDCVDDPGGPRCEHVGVGGAAGAPPVASGSGGGTPIGEVPPDPGTGALPDGAMDRLQVVSRWFVGDVTRDGHASSQAWASFGFDLDGATYATPTMEGHCVPSDGTSGNPAGAIVDGVGGIDNAFGERLLGPVPGVALPSSVGATQAVTSGRASLLLDLGKEGAQSSYEALSGSFSTVTGDPATPPTASALADGSYPWHRFSFVEVASSPSSYSVSGTWVSAPPTTITVALPVQQGLAFLRIHHATVTLTPVLGQVVGNLGGVLDPTELASAIVLARGVCDDTSALATTLAGYADVMLDGTQSPGVPCEGISIGLGFATAPATLGAVATIPAPVDPCAP